MREERRVRGEKRGWEGRQKRREERSLCLTNRDMYIGTTLSKSPSHGHNTISPDNHSEHDNTFQILTYTAKHCDKKYSTLSEQESERKERNFSGSFPILYMAAKGSRSCKGGLPVSISTTVHPTLLSKEGRDEDGWEGWGQSRAGLEASEDTQHN